MAFEIVYNKALKIYSQLYVGLKPQGNGKVVPLAFATPYETTAAGLKRQATVRTWALGHRIYDSTNREYIEFKPDLRVVDNVPREGFKITDDVKRIYWGGGNVVWRLEDPLGWEIEIQSSNLMALIQAVGIQKDGVIEGKCVIARDGAHNVLLPVSSQEYKDAIQAAESVKAPAKIPMKDRVIGRTYRLQDGTYGTYLGKHWVSAQDYGHTDHYLKDKLLIEHDGNQYMISANVSGKEFSAGSDLYEGVYVSEYDMYPGTSYNYRKTAGRVKYYKSAPLIAELDQAEAITLDEAIDLANRSEMAWAGTQSGEPVMAARVQHDRLEWLVRPIQQKTFDDAKAAVLKKAEAEFKSYEQAMQLRAEKPDSQFPQVIKPLFDVGLMTTLHAPILLQLGNKLYQGRHKVDLSWAPWYERKDGVHPIPLIIADRVVLDSRGCRTIGAEQFNSRCELIRRGMAVPDTTTIIYDTFDTIAAFEAELQKWFDLGRFVEKYAAARIARIS